MAIPRWASNLGVLIGVYVAVMAGAALWLPHEWDLAFWDRVSSEHAPSFDQDEVAIVDVPWSDDKALDRTRVAAFLTNLSKSAELPDAVVLDIQFGPCETGTCEGRMAAAVRALTAAIRTATGKFPVYAMERPTVDKQDDATGLEPHDADIYEALSGAAHTRFTTLGHVRFYRTCYDVPVTSGEQTVWDMVERVDMRPEVFTRAVCRGDSVAVRLPADDRETIAEAAAAVTTLTSQGTFGTQAHFAHKDLIVGTIANDPGDGIIPGPELLAWALSNGLNPVSREGAERVYDTEPQNERLLLLVPGFSALTLTAYVAIFFLMRRLRLRALRPALPWLCAVAAALAGLGVFAAFEWWMLESGATGHIQPQITLVAVAIALTAALASVRAYQFLFREQWGIEAGAPESYDYDVFISYAHEEGAWVFEHVFAPLRDARLPDGGKLSIFFDTEEIRYGTPWQDKITLSLIGSRIVVPVYSETYFKKPYCKFEIAEAHLKWIKEGRDSRCVLPIMRGKPAIPATVGGIQAVSIDDVPDLPARVVNEILERIAKLRTPAVVATLLLAAFAFPQAGSAQTVRTHAVRQILLDGKDVASETGVTVTPKDAASQQGIRRGETLADGTRVDVPARVVLVVESTGAKSVERLEPGASLTFVSTGPGELVRCNGGRTSFEVVHGALDFFRVQTGNQITAGVDGTAFAIDASSNAVTFTVQSDEVTVARGGAIRTTTTRRPFTLASVVAPGTPATYALNTPALADFATFADAEKFYADQVSASAGADTAVRTAALVNLGSAQELTGDYAGALQTFQDALALERASGGKDGTARILGNVGVVLNDLGRYDEATKSQEDAIALLRAAGDREGEGYALTNLANVQSHRSDYDGARRSLDAALAIAHELNDRRSEALALATLGLVQFNQAQPDLALASYQAAVTTFKELGDLDAEARIISNEGLIQEDRHDYGAARQSYEASLSIARALGDRDAEARALANIGNAQFKSLDPTAAADSYRKALAIARDTGDLDAQASILVNLGLTQEVLGDKPAALETYRRALAVYRQLGIQGPRVDAVVHAIDRVQPAAGPS